MRKLNLKSSVIISYIVIFLIICTGFYIYENEKNSRRFIDMDYEDIVWERTENIELGISFDSFKKEFISEDEDNGTIFIGIPIRKNTKYDQYMRGEYEIAIYSQKNTIFFRSEDSRSTDIVEQDIFPEFDKEITTDRYKYKTDTRMTIYEGDLDKGYSLKGFYRKENRFVGLTQPACNSDFTSNDLFKVNPDRTRKQTENCRKIFNHILDSIEFI